MEKFTAEFGVDRVDVYFGSESIETLLSLLEGKKYVVITDEVVNEAYGDFVDNAFFGGYKYVVPAGEKSKSFPEVQRVLKFMASKNFDRTSAIVAFGGGVVGDMAGFCASLYMRGISYYQLPTTLLAQVDSCLGGKTGINFFDAKNLVGAFYQPKGIFVNTQFLKSLPQNELRCGYGEAVKTALLDKRVYAYIAKGGTSLDETVRFCLEFKAKIVSQDDKEKGLRKILNLGHTIGHAFEEMNLGGDMRHGEYVLIGLCYETDIAKKLGLLDKKIYDEIRGLIFKFKNDIPAISDIDAFYKKLMLDKKNDSNGISFILLTELFKTKEVFLKKKDIYQLLGEINESYS